MRLVGDGDVLPLKGRDLTVFEIPDHAAGSLAFLDRRERILFSGDEFMERGKTLNGSVSHWLAMLEKLLPHRREFDVLFGGGGRLDASVYDSQLACTLHILEGHEGSPAEPAHFPNFERIDAQGRKVWKRRLPHPGDGPANMNDDLEFRRTMVWAGTSITYDVRNI